MTDDRLTAALTRHLEAGGALPELGPPYDDLVAGLVSDTLLEDERASALRLLDEHPAYRTLLARVEADAEAAVAAPAARRTLRWPRLAAAAVLLAGLGVAIFLMSQRETVPLTADQQLVASAKTLRERAPDVFGDFAPLDAVQRAERPDDVRRGGLQLKTPRGVLVDKYPIFRWTKPAGVKSLSLTVRNEDGEVVGEVTQFADQHLWPPDGDGLAPGRYVWKLVATTAARRLTSTMAFTIADQALADRYLGGLDVIYATNAPDKGVLAAHWAIHNGMWMQASNILEATESSGPLIDETRAWIKARLGE